MAQRKRKRKMSKAQRDALAKGRRALARKRKSRKRTTKKRRRVSGASGGRGGMVLPEGTKMASTSGGRRRKRRKSRRRRRYSGAAGGVPVAGRRRRRSRRRYYGGGARGAGMLQPVIDGAMVVGGAVGGSFIAGALPMIPANMKPFIPIAAGVLLNTLRQTRTQPMMRNLGLGMITAGGLSLVRQFAPQVPLMTGEVEDELMGVPMLGLEEDDLDELLGQDDEDLEDLLGQDEDDLEDLDLEGEENDFVTAADVV